MSPVAVVAVLGLVVIVVAVVVVAYFSIRSVCFLTDTVNDDAICSTIMHRVYISENGCSTDTEEDAIKNMNQTSNSRSFGKIYISFDICTMSRIETRSADRSNLETLRGRFARGIRRVKCTYS